MSSDPKITIDGSSRMVGYEDKLDLIATIRDLDLSPIEAEEFIYNCFWECINIASGQVCTDVADQILQFFNKCNLTLQPHTLAPYNVFEFSVSIIKKNVKFTTKVNIQTMEVSLPQLNVSKINQDQLYNYYNELILKITYPGVNPDLLMYAGAIIYNQITVSTFQFYYLDFKFKLQDYFTNLTQKEGKQIRLRLSVYDPHFVMPSLATLKFPMNIPPQKCQLQFVTDIVVEFIVQLNINVIKCQDLEFPLTYSVLLYANESIYKQDLIRARFYHNLQLIPSQQNASFNISLPYHQQNLLVVLIKDSIGGINNITTSIKVQKLNEINEDTFRNYFNQQIGLDYQLIGYRVIVERLSSLDGLLDYKEELFKELIQIQPLQQLRWPSNIRFSVLDFSFREKQIQFALSFFLLQSNIQQMFKFSKKGNQYINFIQFKFRFFSKKLSFEFENQGFNVCYINMICKKNLISKKVFQFATEKLDFNMNYQREFWRINRKIQSRIYYSVTNWIEKGLIGLGVQN